LKLLEEREAAGAVLTTYALAQHQKLKERLHVLVSEDNPVNQRLIARLLEKRGPHVALAGNGHEALDLVFVDVQMAVMDGLEATAEQREHDKLGGIHTPIIALTAHAMKGDRERCLEAEVDGDLTKPIRAEELGELLERHTVSGAVDQAVPESQEKIT
jgi:two-component system, sensor histidine kinase and response regulator